MIKMMIGIMTGMMVMMMKIKKVANFAIMPKIIFPTITMMMIGITGMMIMIAYKVTNFVTMVVVIATPMIMVIITSSSRNGAPRCELPYCQQVRIGYGLRRVVAYN